MLSFSGFLALRLVLTLRREEALLLPVAVPLGRPDICLMGRILAWLMDSRSIVKYPLPCSEAFGDDRRLPTMPMLL